MTTRFKPLTPQFIRLARIVWSLEDTRRMYLNLAWERGGVEFVNHITEQIETCECGYRSIEMERCPICGVNKMEPIR